MGWLNKKQNLYVLYYLYHCTAAISRIYDTQLFFSHFPHLLSKTLVSGYSKITNKLLKHWCCCRIVRFTFSQAGYLSWPPTKQTVSKYLKPNKYMHMKQDNLCNKEQKLQTVVLVRLEYVIYHLIWQTTRWRSFWRTITMKLGPGSKQTEYSNCYWEW